MNSSTSRESCILEKNRTCYEPKNIIRKSLPFQKSITRRNRRNERENSRLQKRKERQQQSEQPQETEVIDTACRSSLCRYIEHHTHHSPSCFHQPSTISLSIKKNRMEKNIISGITEQPPLYQKCWLAIQILKPYGGIFSVIFTRIFSSSTLVAMSPQTREAKTERRNTITVVQYATTIRER